MAEKWEKITKKPDEITPVELARTMSISMLTNEEHKSVADMEFAPRKYPAPADEDFEPYDHRLILKPTTYLESMVHMLKGSIGAGLLAMPSAVAMIGIYQAIIWIIIVGFLGVHTFLLLVRTQYLLCKRHKVGYMSYHKAMRVAILEGPKCMKWLSKYVEYTVIGTLLMWQFGLCLVYSIFVAENIKQVLELHGYPVKIRYLIMILIIPTLLVNCSRSLKWLTPLSTLSNILTSLGVLLIFFYLIEDDVTFEDYKFEFKNLEKVPTFIGTTLFALEAVGVVLALEFNMEEPRRFGGFCGLFNISMMTTLVLYGTMGIFGYMRFGDSVHASITLSLPQEDKKAQTCKLMYAFAIFLSHPLQNIVAYQLIWQKVRKRIKKSNPNQVSDHIILDYAIRLSCALFPCIIAVMLPTLGPLISLMGAFCLSLLGVVFPGLMFLCYWHSSVLGFGVMRQRMWHGLGIMSFGIFALISGTYTSIGEIVTHEF